MSTQRTYRIAGSQLTIDFGSVLDVPTEVVVSSDDYQLSMGGGVSAAIRIAAGNALVLDAAKAVPREAGDVVVTTAGALPARYVFHVVTIGQGFREDPGAGRLAGGSGEAHPTGARRSPTARTSAEPHGTGRSPGRRSVPGQLPHGAWMPACAGKVTVEPMVTMLMLDPGRDHKVLRAGHHRLRGEVDCLLGRPGLFVDGDVRLRQPRRQPGIPGYVEGLWLICETHPMITSSTAAGSNSRPAPPARAGHGPPGRPGRYLAIPFLPPIRPHRTGYERFRHHGLVQGYRAAASG